MNINIFKMKRELKVWKLGALGSKLWSPDAQRGTLLITMAEDGAHAVLVDDQGVRDAFKVPHGQLGEVIGAAAQSWIDRGAGGSLAVYTELKKRGDLTPPPPPPPPGPGGHETIFTMQAAAAHTTFDVAAAFANHEHFGEGKDLTHG